MIKLLERVSLRGPRPRRSRLFSCLFWIASSLTFLAMASVFAQDVKSPHQGMNEATGVITGKVLKDGKTPLAGATVTLEILRDHRVVLAIPKEADKEGRYQFKNIFKSSEFSYAVSTEFEGKTYRSPFTSLSKNESSKKVDLKVGPGAKEGPPLPPPVDEKTMNETEMGEHAHASKKFSDYQLLAVILAIAAISYAIYQRKKK